MSPVPLYLCTSLSLLILLRLSLYFNKFIAFRVRCTNAPRTQEPTSELNRPYFNLVANRVHPIAMQRDGKVTIVRPTKATFDPSNPQAYGKFMVSVCTMNNSLGYLTDNYFVVTEDEALTFQEDIDESLIDHMSGEEKEASNKAIRMAPSNGLTPFATPSKDKKLSNAQIEISKRFEGVNQARHQEAVGSSSTAYALAAVKRATSMTRIFINKTTLKCETHQERLFHMELYAYLIDGLPKQLLQRIVVGDICTVYLKIMALGQTNAVATRRKLNNLMNNIQKGANTWPTYLQSFYDISDAQEASGVDRSEEDLLGCLINGLTLDARYKDVIREIECSRTPLSLSKAIDLITAHAIHCQDDQLLPSAPVKTYNVEIKAEPSEKALCRKFQSKQPCYHDPCPYSHGQGPNSSGTSPYGTSPINAERSRQKSKDPKPNNRACRALVELKECRYKDKCRFSHDSKLVEAARQAFAGSIEIDDYFAEANCIEEPQPQPIITEIKESNSIGKFRDIQGSPKDRQRKSRKQRNLFLRNKTYPPDPPASQDAESNLPTFDDLDAPDCPTHEHAGEKSADRLTGNTNSAYWLPGLTIPASACLNQAALRDSEHVNTVDLATAYYQIPIASMNPSSYDWNDLPTETAFTVTSKQTEQTLLEPMPAVFDTGASAHCFPNTEFFLKAAIPNSLVDCHVVIKTARKGEVLVATKKADLILTPNNMSGRPLSTEHSSVVLHQVLLADGIRRGLVSATALTNDGYSLNFEKNQCTLRDSHGLHCLTVPRNTGSLYEIPNAFFARPPVAATDKSEEAHLARTYSDNSIELWHQRLGHCSLGRLSGLFKEKGLKVDPQHDNCIACTQAKIHRTAYPKTAEFRADFPGQSFAVDFMGPFKVQSPFGHRYMCMFVDIKSRHGYCVPAKLKSELSTLVDHYIAMVERVQQPNKTVTIVSDGALCDKDHLTSLRARGITVLIVAPGASRLNGVAERRNRTTEEGGRAMNINAGLPPTFFIVACEYENAIQNYIPLTDATLNRTQHVNSGKTFHSAKRNACPQEIWSRRRLGLWDDLLGDFRVFGCLAYALIRNPNKQVAKAERSIFLGMATDNHNAYLLMSLETKTFSRFMKSRDVVCHEHILPFKKAMELPAHIRANSDSEHGALDSASDIEAIVTRTDTLEPPASDIEAIVTRTNTLEPPVAVLAPDPCSMEPPDLRSVEPPIKSVNDVPATDHEHVNKQLSFSDIPMKEVRFDLERNVSHAALPTLVPSDFDRRQQLGTGDINHQARTSPARHLVVGQTYDTLLADGRCTVHEINADGDLQVTFPDYINPNELFTLEKEQIVVNTAKKEEAHALEKQADRATIQVGPLDAFSIETPDGEFITSQEFTTTMLASEEALSIVSQTASRPPTTWSNRKNQVELGTRIIQPATLNLEDLVGKVPADSIVVPRTHYELKNNAIRPLVERSQTAEMETLIRKNVFQNAHTALPTDHVVPTMFVNRAKGDAQGMLAKIKSRLTSRGDLDQAPAGTKRQTYAAVLLPCTLRLLISLHCADKETNFFQLDYEAAFVTAPATRRIVVRLPPGYYGPGPKVPNAVHVLNFNLYGGDDAPLVYQNFMFSCHKKLGFSGIMQDHCYLELHRGQQFIKFVVHVDDFLIAQRGDELWNWYLTELKKDFTYTVAPLSFFVGMRFVRDAKTGSYQIDQEAQIDKMSRAFDVKLGARPTSTPIISFSEEDRPKLTDLPSTDIEKAAALKIPFRQGVGHLNYLAQCTYPEIVLPTRIAASFMQAWGKKHWQWVKNIMLFLVSKSSKYLTITGSLEHRELSGWTDSDHAGNPDDRRSRSAHQIWLGNDLIDWYGRSQTIVAHSSAESELMALDACVRQMQHLRWLLEALNAPARNPSVINMDSSSALGMAENPIQNRRNRHIHARFFYVRDLINDGIVRLNKVNTEDNRADLLATYKDAATFRRLLGICKPQPPD